MFDRMVLPILRAWENAKREALFGKIPISFGSTWSMVGSDTQNA
jgi:hypothetical protein